MSLPDQIILCRGDAFHDGLRGGDFEGEDCIDIEAAERWSLRDVPPATSTGMLEGMRHKIAWTRFEVDALTRCGDDFVLTGHVASLLVAGKHDGRTRKQILEAIRLQEATRTRLDDFDLVDVVTMLKGF